MYFIKMLSTVPKCQTPPVSHSVVTISQDLALWALYYICSNPMGPNLLKLLSKPHVDSTEKMAELEYKEAED